MVECGITNLGACLPEKFFEYIHSLMNAPIQGLLGLVKGLLTEPVNLQPYSYFWAVIIYILSMFYGLLIVYVGFNFMFSGHNVVKRENAKSWFRNVIIMIVLVQASYFLYTLIAEIGSLLTAGTMSLIDPNFFLLSADNLTSFGLELLLYAVYLLTLLITVILLVIRMIFVGVGVISFPIGIFLYFIPPLRGYGRFILNMVGIAIFITFFDTLILLASSMLIHADFFANYKIIVMISAFSMVNIAWILALFFSRDTSGKGMSQSLKTIANLMVKMSG